MATLSSIGIGSGLDANLVSRLVEAERAPNELRISRASDTAKAQISAFGALKSALSGLEGALKKFDGDGAQSGRKLVLPEGAGFSASAGVKAAPGRHEIVVERLATAHKSQTAAIARASDGASPVVGHGTLSIQVGNETAINIAIDPAKNRLSDIRDAINAAGTGKFSASIVRGDDGDVLTLTSLKTGSANALNVSQHGGDGGLAAITGSHLQQQTAAQDALVRIDGISSTRGSNRFDDVIDGISLDLTKADPDKPFTMEIQPDNSTLKASLLGFISAYNTAMSQLRTQSAAGGSGKTSGPLSGDAAPRGITAALRNTIAGAYGELSSLGVKSSVDGSLSLDGAKFDAALNADPQALRKVLGESASAGKTLRDGLKSWVGSGGMIESRSKSLDQRMSAIERQKSDLDARMERIEAAYKRQFIALDAAMSKLNGTSTFITQQFFSNKN